MYTFTECEGSIQSFSRKRGIKKMKVQANLTVFALTTLMLTQNKNIAKHYF